MIKRPETPADLALVRIGLRLIGYGDGGADAVFPATPYAALISQRWEVIFYCWCVAGPALTLVWLGLWALLHAGGLLGRDVLVIGSVFLLASSLTGALDALWRSTIAGPASKRARVRDMTETELNGALRLAQIDDKRLLLQVFVGLTAAALAIVFWY